MFSLQEKSDATEGNSEHGRLDNLITWETDFLWERKKEKKKDGKTKKERVGGWMKYKWKIFYESIRLLTQQ